MEARPAAAHLTLCLCGLTGTLAGHRDISPMRPEFDQVIQLLERDVMQTVGESYRSLVRDAAANVRDLDVADGAAKVVEDVQQYLHDTSVDTTWPPCPRHLRHPLCYRDGAWWCERDGAALAPLGELRAVGSSSP